MRALARCLTEAESYLATQAISRLAGPDTLTHAAVRGLGWVTKDASGKCACAACCTAISQAQRTAQSARRPTACQARPDGSTDAAVVRDAAAAYPQQRAASRPVPSTGGGRALARLAGFLHRHYASEPAQAAGSAEDAAGPAQAAGPVQDGVQGPQGAAGWQRGVSAEGRRDWPPSPAPQWWQVAEPALDSAPTPTTHAPSSGAQPPSKASVGWLGGPRKTDADSRAPSRDPQGSRGRRAPPAPAQPGAPRVLDDLHMRLSKCRTVGELQGAVEHVIGSTTEPRALAPSHLTFIAEAVANVLATTPGSPTAQVRASRVQQGGAKQGDRAAGVAAGAGGGQDLITPLRAVRDLIVASGWAWLHQRPSVPIALSLTDHAGAYQPSQASPCVRPWGWDRMPDHDLTDPLPHTSLEPSSAYSTIGDSLGSLGGFSQQSEATGATAQLDRTGTGTGTASYRSLETEDLSHLPQQPHQPPPQPQQPQTQQHQPPHQQQQQSQLSRQSVQQQQVRLVRDPAEALQVHCLTAVEYITELYTPFFAIQKTLNSVQGTDQDQQTAPERGSGDGCIVQLSSTLTAVLQRAHRLPPAAVRAQLPVLPRSADAGLPLGARLVQVASAVLPAAGSDPTVSHALSELILANLPHTFSHSHTLSPILTPPTHLQPEHLAALAGLFAKYQNCVHAQVFPTLADALLRTPANARTPTWSLTHTYVCMGVSNNQLGKLSAEGLVGALTAFAKVGMGGHAVVGELARVACARLSAAAGHESHGLASWLSRLPTLSSLQQQQRPAAAAAAAAPPFTAAQLAELATAARSCAATGQPLPQLARLVQAAAATRLAAQAEPPPETAAAPEQNARVRRATTATVTNLLWGLKGAAAGTKDMPSTLLLESAAKVLNMRGVLALPQSITTRALLKLIDVYLPAPRSEEASFLCFHQPNHLNPRTTTHQPPTDTEHLETDKDSSHTALIRCLMSELARTLAASTRVPNGGMWAHQIGGRARANALLTDAAMICGLAQRVAALDVPTPHTQRVLRMLCEWMLRVLRLSEPPRGAVAAAVQSEGEGDGLWWQMSDQGGAVCERCAPVTTTAVSLLPAAAGVIVACARQGVRHDVLLARIDATIAAATEEARDAAPALPLTPTQLAGLAAACAQVAAAAPAVLAAAAAACADLPHLPLTAVAHLLWAQLVMPCCAPVCTEVTECTAPGHTERAVRPLVTNWDTALETYRSSWSLKIEDVMSPSIILLAQVHMLLLAHHGKRVSANTDDTSVPMSLVNSLQYAWNHHLTATQSLATNSQSAGDSDVTDTPTDTPNTTISSALIQQQVLGTLKGLAGGVTRGYERGPKKGSLPRSLSKYVLASDVSIVSPKQVSVVLEGFAVPIDCSVTVDGMLVAVLCNGQERYTAPAARKSPTVAHGADNACTLLGQYIWRDQLLRMLGWECVTVPYYEWQPLVAPMDTFLDTNPDSNAGMGSVGKVHGGVIGVQDAPVENSVWQSAREQARGTGRSQWAGTVESVLGTRPSSDGSQEYDWYRERSARLLVTERQRYLLGKLQDRYGSM